MVEQKLNLLLGVHSHITEDVFIENGKPGSISNYVNLIEAFENCKNLKVNIHFSGRLLSALDKQISGFSNKISKLLNENKLELISGGLHEPLFPFIPKDDRQAHLLLMNRLLSHLYGYTPSGVWTTKFVWEPSLALDFAKSRLQYTCLPKEHFTFAGLEEKELSGYFITEEEGKKIAVFPITRLINDLIENSTPDEAVKQIFSKLSSSDGDVPLVALFYNGQITDSDRLEWLIKFFQTVDNNCDYIKTHLLNEYFLNHKPKGRIYLPTTQQSTLLSLRGFWKHSLLNCIEANLLHKKMLRVSKKINAAKEGKSRFKVIKEMINQAHDLLLQGQSNDAYWISKVTGIYEPQKRYASYRDLIKAENLIDSASRQGTKWIQVSEIDYDCDGHDEIIIETETNNIYISPYLGGAILEHDYRPRNLNLTNVILEEKGIAKSGDIKDDSNYLKLHLLDHFLNKNTLLEDCKTKTMKSLTKDIVLPYQVEKIKAKEETCKVLLKLNTCIENESEIELLKEINTRSGEGSLFVDYMILNRGSKKVDCMFAIEFNLNVTTVLDKNSYFYLDKNPQKKTLKPDLDAVEEINNVNQISIKSDIRKIDLTISTNKNCNIYRYPIELYLKGEDSQKNIFQGTTILLNWPLLLEPGASWDVSIKQDVETEIDIEN